MTDIFRFEQAGIGPGGEILGELKPTGMRPMFMSRLETHGFKLGPEVFGVSLGEPGDMRHLQQRRRR